MYAGWFKALSDPTRIQVLHVVATEGVEMTVGDIVKRLPVAQSTVSHHLKILADTRFVLLRREGTTSHYRVNRKCFDEFPNAAAAVMALAPATTSEGNCGG